MGITGLYTADIYVRDLEKAVDFYVNKLGFEKRADEPVDEEGHRWVEVAPNGSETALVLSHGFGSWSPEKVGGWCRLIFRVEDMAGTVEALKAEGVEFEGEPEEAPYGTYAQVRDPDGNVFGLLEEARG
jgi:predicted enzyme related to lactoylglutathione lyase